MRRAPLCHSTAGERTRGGRGSGVDDDRHARVLEGPPGRVESRVGRGEPADLDVHLEQSRAGLERVGDVPTHPVLGKERGRVHGVRHAGSELRAPVVEPPRHPWLVRVGQRRDRPQPEGTDEVQAVLFPGPVVHRPGHSVAGLGPVEEGPDLAQHGVGQEVDVDVGQPGQAQRPPVGRDPGVRGGRHRHRRNATRSRSRPAGPRRLPGRRRRRPAVLLRGPGGRTSP